MSRFIDNGDNTITDTKTGLIWTKNTIASDVTHEVAEKACHELEGEWRLPTIDELFTLVDHTKYDPAIDKDMFPDTESDWYWSSTETAWNPSAVWIVLFDDGFVTYYHRYLNACVRALRASQ